MLDESMSLRCNREWSQLKASKLIAVPFSMSPLFPTRRQWIIPLAEMFIM
jgi:hypothetical protein